MSSTPHYNFGSTNGNHKFDHDAFSSSDDLQYILLQEECNPEVWFLDTTLSFLGKLQTHHDSRYDILKERARKQASINPRDLERHIERVRKQEQHQARIEMTLDELLDTEFPPIRWVIPDRLPEGCTLLAGKKGMGKSMLVLNFALAVATGGVALGKYDVDAGDVLYYALEDPRRHLKTRLMQMLPPQRPRSRLTFRFTAPKIGDGLLEEITAWLDEHPEARLVVLDILARVRPARHRGSNAYQQDYATLEQLQDLARALGVNILAVTHTRKADASDVFDTINASTGLIGAADTAMVITRVRGQVDATLHITSRDLEADLELAIQFDPASALWSEIGGAEVYRQTKERSQTLSAIARLREPFGPEDLAAALDLSNDTAQKRLARLYQEGLLDRKKRGQYTRTLSFVQASPPRADTAEPAPSPVAHGLSDCPIVRNDTHETDNLSVSDNKDGKGCPEASPEESRRLDAFGQSDIQTANLPSDHIAHGVSDCPEQG